jgi:hypothetical protein
MAETPLSEDDQAPRISGELLAFPPPWEAGSLATGWGLTKRELFAAMAMQGIMQNTLRNDDPYLVASRAVNVADILLKELAK